MMDGATNSKTLISLRACPGALAPGQARRLTTDFDVKGSFIILLAVLAIKRPARFDR
jgi:hypothetical protein